MSTESVVARLRRYNAGLESRQPVSNEGILEEAAFSNGRSLEDHLEQESIILKARRPVLAVLGDEAQLTFSNPEETKLWKEPLESAKEQLTNACQAVGRIELSGHEALEWIGTGWLVAPDVMVTNRHVALGFAEHPRLTFKIGHQGPMGADIDFRQEFESNAARLFKITKPLFIEPVGGPDLAFFQVEQTSDAGKLASHVVLSCDLPSDVRKVAVIGYPARDSRIPDQALMDRLYGNLYDKKRLAPGEVTRVESARVLHNCTTLGGNSGSVVLDLVSGLALGLHFSGRFLTTNFAVRADTVAQRLDDVRSGKARSRSAPTPQRRRDARPVPDHTARQNDGSATLTVPLTITITLGTPSPAGARRSSTALRSQGGSADQPIIEDDVADEAKAEDYADRPGYVANFLGQGFSVPLPNTDGVADDVLSFEDRGKTETRLRYQHFTVVMSRKRRMCYFSAVNIDGETSKKTKRAGWRTDPRIAKKAQILSECYGDPPKFSRGHMTRREDPAWGGVAKAQLGNVDSMHVTNATPQMQAFNSPIWLELEDFALQNARQDDMKISVFTGPYFDYDGVKDPRIDNVRIPRAFWKIVAFVHDETGELSATGYEMSQEDNLPQDSEEFVFGDFVSSHINRSTQVSIASIEARTGLSFGKLVDADPLATANESFEAPAPLERLEQIRFR